MYQRLICNFVICIGCLILLSNVVFAQTKPTGGMMRYPDVSADKIAFVYADDIWVVSRDGGMAFPLSSPEGAERMPRFSPDGKSIAFVGNYEGGTDLYTIPVTGGIAERKTFHPSSELLCDWTPDGKNLLYSTNGFSGLGRVPQLFTISEALKPLPKQLPVPYGTNGAISPDNKWLAYTPHSRDTRTWKRYRGGMASDIWLFNLQDKTSKQITDFEGTDSLPMWNGKKVYYLSDAGDEARLNIWSYHTETGERKQVTTFEDYDCKWPSIGPGSNGKGEIVFSNGSSLYLLDLANEKSKSVDISVPGDRPTIRPKKRKVAESIAGGDISKSGKRLVLEARGDIWTVPVKHGSPRNLTKTSGEAERDPVWSPDGRWIAYLSDKTGEYELYITQSDGRGETKQLTDDGDSYRYLSTWSPDSKRIAFSNKAGELFLFSMESKDVKLIDTDPAAQQIDVSWSHDSNWICYSKATDQRSPSSSIWAYKISDGTRQQLTSGYFQDAGPVFDAEGKYIYFRSQRSFTSPQYDDLGTTFIYPQTGVLMAMPLQADFEHPLGPKIDEEEWEEEKDGEDSDDSDSENEESEKDSDSKNGESDKKENSNSKSKDKSKDKSEEPDAEEKDDKDESSDDEDEESDEDDKDDDDKKKDKKEVEPVTIDFADIEKRAFQVPVGAGNFGELLVNSKNQLIFAKMPAAGTDGKPEIKLFDFADDKKEAKTVVAGTGNFGISADGKKLIVYADEKFYVIDAAADQKLEKPVSTKGMTVVVNPREEWKQIFWDAWRLERDFFYDPTMHGVDWKVVGKQYEKMLADCVSRSDVTFVIGEMISELNVGHAYYRTSGNNGPSNDVGLLGCRFEADGDAYKIAELYEGAIWDIDARNPLAAAGVKAGQYLLAVNDQLLTVKENPFEALRGTVGQTVTVTISDDKTLDDDDKRVVVKPMGSDRNLRFRGWIEANRKYVDEQTDGRVGYIYVVNTGIPGQNDLVRQFYAQLNKEALIVDDRWNGGGQIPTRFIELMNRPVTNYWARRDGRDWTWPPDSHQGPKCMLINGMAGSGGDMFPALFKQAGLGKLIGMRTWGGLVGISGGPRLIDGTAVTVPSFAYYENDGTWGIEGHGVDPDIKVIDDPAKMIDGGDPQLDAAIEQMKKELEKSAYQPPKRPEYPDRSKFGITPEDK